MPHLTSLFAPFSHISRRPRAHHCPCQCLVLVSPVSPPAPFCFCLRSVLPLMSAKTCYWTCHLLIQQHQDSLVWQVFLPKPYLPPPSAPFSGKPRRQSGRPTRCSNSARPSKELPKPKAPKKKKRPCRFPSAAGRRPSPSSSTLGITPSQRRPPFPLCRVSLAVP